MTRVGVAINRSGENNKEKVLGGMSGVQLLMLNLRCPLDL